jgi:hypothetical protein
MPQVKSGADLQGGDREIQPTTPRRPSQQEGPGFILIELLVIIAVD